MDNTRLFSNISKCNQLIKNVNTNDEMRNIIIDNKNRLLENIRNIYRNENNYHSYKFFVKNLSYISLILTDNKLLILKEISTFDGINQFIRISHEINSETIKKEALNDL
jgi:hypothetical protein